MATHLGTYTNSASTGTDANVVISASPGNVIEVSVQFNNQTTIVDNNSTTPWTEDFDDYKPNTSGGHTISLFSRRFQSGDPTTLHFTGGTSGRWSIIVNVWDGIDPVSIYDVAPSSGNAANADNSSAATIIAPSITTLSANAIHRVIGFFDDGTAGAPSGPAGYTSAGGENDEPQGSFYKVITVAGATGDQTITGTTSAPRIAISYALKSAVSQNFITYRFPWRP